MIVCVESMQVFPSPKLVDSLCVGREPWELGYVCSDPREIASPLLLMHVGIASLLDVRVELKEAAPFWMDLGLALGLLQHTLQSINLQNSEDVGQCLTETLAAWLQGKDGVATPTWRAIVEALLSPAINFYRLALQIAATYHNGRTTGSVEPDEEHDHLGR